MDIIFGFRYSVIDSYHGFNAQFSRVAGTQIQKHIEYVICIQI